MQSFLCARTLAINDNKRAVINGRYALKEFIAFCMRDCGHARYNGGELVVTSPPKFMDLPEMALSSLAAP